MKSKIEYYAKKIGINIWTALIPVLAVVLIYGLGKIVNILTHPCAASQEIYDCCVSALITILTGFSVGWWAVAFMAKWRRLRLFKLELEKNSISEEDFFKGIVASVLKPTAGGPMPEQSADKDSDSESKAKEEEDEEEGKSLMFEDISGLSVKEIWQRYANREVFVESSTIPLVAKTCLAGYDEEGEILYVGFQSPIYGMSWEEITTLSNANPNGSHVESGYRSYGCYIPNLVHVRKI